MTASKTKLQSRVLAARKFPGVKSAFAFYYWLGTRAFLWFTQRTNKKFGHIVQSVYLRRGGGRNELLPGASDLDFFLVFRTVGAEREMEFLKAFWEAYHWWRVPFPFLGEVLMGDENELINWLEAPNVRSYEANFSWKLLSGEDVLSKAVPSPQPDLRDVFSESLKYYWALLQPTLKLRPEHFQKNLLAHQPSAVHLRNAAKAALDLFRLHHTRKLAPESRKRLWMASRAELIPLLPAEYGVQARELLPVLLLENPLFPERAPFEIFSSLIHKASVCLHEMAMELSARADETTLSSGWKVQYHGKKSAKDPYSFSVRELFAERMLFRHSDVVQRAVLSEDTAHMYFLMKNPPSLEETRDVLEDLRDASFSFDRFSVAMPVTEACFAEMERTSLLDTPFHSFYAHQEISFNAADELESRRYQPKEPRIPESMLQKTFAELSFSLRLQPLEMEYLLEKMVALVLSMRLAADAGVIVTDFDSTLQCFTERFPERGKKLRHDLAPYQMKTEAKEIWSGVRSALASFSTHDPLLVSRLEEQWRRLERENQALPESKTAITDLWINLTPVLRMEINAMKDRYFYRRPILKI